MMIPITYAQAGRKEQLAYLTNLIFIATGVIFIIHDYFSDYRVDGYWSPGSIRQVELIVFGGVVIALLRLEFMKTAKLITALSLPLIFFVTPVFIELNHLEMYYINTLLLPVMVLIPSLVFTHRENHRLILLLFLTTLGVNFICEQYVFSTKQVSAADLEFYNYHFVLFSMAKVFTSLFIYVNVTRMFRQNELFESRIVNANDELKHSNELIQSQNLRIEMQVAALKENADKLKELDTAKSNFFANISHEFRTPLTLLLSPLEEQIQKSVDPVRKEQFIVMKRNATRLHNLVNQLLDLSKLESGSMKLRAAYTDLSALLRQWVSQFVSIAEARKIEFKVDLPDEMQLWLDVDKIEKIVMNLLANAFKFTPAGGVVSLVVRKAQPSNGIGDGHVEIEVSDSGIGIDEVNLGKIFDRFYQVNDSSRREYGGTGIGLALVKELTEAHRGSIRVYSNPGQGSIFTVNLPLGKTHLREGEIAEFDQQVDSVLTGIPGLSDLHSQPTLTQPLPVVSDERPLVLVVEDSADLQQYLAQGLSEECRVLRSMNGQEGIEVAFMELPDLILSDLMMPKVDGLTLLRTLKADVRTSHIPVILLTAKADVVTRLEGFETGADDYIAKPFDMVELKARIRNLIEGRRKLREKFAVNIIRANEMKVDSVDDVFMKKVLTSIEAHIADDNFGVPVLAADVSMSTIQLYRKLKALAGTTPNDLIKNLRLDRAKSLLDQRTGNVSEIARQSGFRNMSYFAKCFKEKFGYNPSESPVKL